MQLISTKIKFLILCFLFEFCCVFYQDPNQLVIYIKDEVIIKNIYMCLSYYLTVNRFSTLSTQMRLTDRRLWVCLNANVIKILLFYHPSCSDSAKCWIISISRFLISFFLPYLIMASILQFRFKKDVVIANVLLWLRLSEGQTAWLKLGKDLNHC